MIYLDHAATWPMSPEVAEVVRPWLGRPANPASIHAAGRAAAIAVEQAREHVARLLDRPPAGVVFTSGATEANHAGLRGWVALGVRTAAVSALEHPSVRGALAASGIEVRALPVGVDGRVELRDCPPVDLLVLMAANHETGVLQPVERALQVVRGRPGARLHVDATQSAAWVPLDLAGVDSVVISAHKLGGPAGVGALSLLGGDPFPALLTGGAQERGRRAGTVPTASVVGFGEACRLARALRGERAERIGALSRELRRALVGLGARVVGAEPRLPGTTCAVFPGVRGETLVQALDLRGVAVSSGAACASGSTQPSPVLLAMGDPEPAGGLRISLGPASTPADLQGLLSALGPALAAIREAASWGAEP